MDGLDEVEDIWNVRVWANIVSAWTAELLALGLLDAWRKAATLSSRPEPYCELHEDLNGSPRIPVSRS